MAVAESLRESQGLQTFAPRRSAMQVMQAILKTSLELATERDPGKRSDTTGAATGGGPKAAALHLSKTLTSAFHVRTPCSATHV